MPVPLMTSSFVIVIRILTVLTRRSCILFVLLLLLIGPVFGMFARSVAVIDDAAGRIELIEHRPQSVIPMPS